MRYKMAAGAIMALLSAIALFWYFSPSDVSIVRLEKPDVLVIGQISSITIYLQNNASEDINVTLNVKNAFVDEKGVSLKGSIYWIEENSSWLNATAQKEVRLRPGNNRIAAEIGFQVAGLQKVEVEVYRQGKLADSGTIELDVLKPRIELLLKRHISFIGTDEIHAVYGDLGLRGTGFASGIKVNISVINELTNNTVSTVTRTYSLGGTEYTPYSSRPLVEWMHNNITYDPLTGAKKTIETKTYAPVAVVELASGKPSNEKYVMSPVVVKGRIDDRYRVVVTASWVDQVVSSEMEIHSAK